MENVQFVLEQQIKGNSVESEKPDEVYASSVAGPRDRFGRVIDYLRISVTDRCNLRCVYCMPEEMTFRPRRELLTDDEIVYLVEIAASLGVDKIQIHGLRALEAAGYVVKDGEEVTERTRAIKGPDEILAMRCAIHSCERAMAAMEDFARTEIP